MGETLPSSSFFPLLFLSSVPLLHLEYEYHQVPYVPVYCFCLRHKAPVRIPLAPLHHHNNLPGEQHLPNHHNNQDKNNDNKKATVPPIIPTSPHFHAPNDRRSTSLTWSKTSRSIFYLFQPPFQEYQGCSKNTKNSKTSLFGAVLPPPRLVQSSNSTATPRR